MNINEKDPFCPVKRKVWEDGEIVKSGADILTVISKDFMVAMLSSPDLLEAVTADKIKEGDFSDTVSKTAIKWAKSLIKHLNKEY